MGKSDVLRAWAVWMLSKQSVYSILTNSWSVEIDKNKAKQIQWSKETFTILYARRLERTSIFCRDAVNVIKSTDRPTTFHYVDPPYFNADMGHYGGYTEDDFARLLEVLSEVEGKFMLSSYPSDVLSDYSIRNGWHTMNVEMTKSAGGGIKTEVFTMNYSVNLIQQLDTDQNYYHVPCPHCGEKQRLVFENLKWDDDKPETAMYCCIHCGSFIEERYKIQMFAAGEWVPAVPEKSSRELIGFHLSSLYSPYGWQSWEDIAREFIAAKASPTRLKVFVNTVLGETWAERGEAPEYMNLYNRRESYKIGEVPQEVCFLTAGVDVQKDRLEVEVVGWCSDKRSYSIDYRVLEGDTARANVWTSLALMLEERWGFAGVGIEIPIRMMAIDSGYNTTHVYDFCRRFGADRVVPVKGQDSLGMPVSAPKTVDVTRSGKRIGRVRLWSVGSSFLKSELYSWLRLEKENGVPPPCYCHFPEYAETYFMGLTAEEQVKKIVRGYPRYEWVKSYERNEPLDCRVYARAAASIVGLDRLAPSVLESIGGRKSAKPQTREPDLFASNYDAAPTAATRRRRSSFWD